MGRKTDIEEEKKTKKAEPKEQAQPQVTVVTENQLIGLKLDTILQKLDEVLAKN
jgi:hypothetical protein